MQGSGTIQNCKRGDCNWDVRVFDLSDGSSRYLPYHTQQKQPVQGFHACKGMVLWQARDSLRVFCLRDPTRGSICEAGQLQGLAIGFGHWQGEYYAFMPGGQVLRLQHDEWIPLRSSDGNAPQVYSIFPNSNELEEHGIIGVYEDPVVGKAVGFFRPDHNAWALICACDGLERDCEGFKLGGFENWEAYVVVGVMGSRIVMEVQLECDVEYRVFDVCSGEWSGVELPSMGLLMPVALAAHGFIYLFSLPGSTDDEVMFTRAELDWKQKPHPVINSTIVSVCEYNDIAFLFL